MRKIFILDSNHPEVMIPIVLSISYPNPPGPGARDEDGTKILMSPAKQSNDTASKDIENRVEYREH